MSTNKTTTNAGDFNNTEEKTGNELGDEGAKALSEALKVNTTLKALFLQRALQGNAKHKDDQTTKTETNREPDLCGRSLRTG